MCGRYAATLPPEMMLDLFRVLNAIDFPPRYNIAPTQPIVVVIEEHGRRSARLARWGLVPRWVKDPRKFPLIINARIEGIAEKPAFRDAIRYRRCIVPASGYYEWRAGPGKTRTPYYITLADGEPMAFAGLHATWSGPEGEEVDTAAIVTVAAANELAQLHEREPAVLQGDAVERWLDVRHVDGNAARQLALPLPPGAARFHPVSTLVNSNTNDGPALIAPVSAEVPQPSTQVRKKAASGQLDLF